MIPKKIIYNFKSYTFIKEYPHVLLYQEDKVGFKECFNKSDLGLVKEQEKVARKPVLRSVFGMQVY